MAQDELLLLRIAADARRPAFRAYDWDGVAVSFGYFQSLLAIQESFPDHTLVRRWTGGGAVLHGDSCEFTYALAVPSSSAFSKLPASESYDAVHRCVAQALQAVGVAGRVSSEGAGTIAEPGLACFQSPVAGDVLLGETNAKVAGAAQRRTRVGLLIQGSIRLSHDIPADLELALAEALGTERITVAPSPPEEIADLVDSKYGRSDWLARKL